MICVLHSTSYLHHRPAVPRCLFTNHPQTAPALKKNVDADLLKKIP